ncbi:MAG: extracellular solute-binding protein [Sphaerochaetaceae bacterium]
MRKVYPFIVALIVFSVVVLAVGKRDTTEQTGPLTIEYWTHEDDSRTALEEELIARFMRENPGIIVHRVTHSSSMQIELVAQAFAAGNGPDMFNIPIENQYAYITKGYVAPVDYPSAGYESRQDLVDGFIDGVFDAVTIKDKIYGLPLEYTNWCVYVDKEAFRSVGLDAEKDYPRTWEDVVRLSSLMVVRDGQVLKRRGFDFRYPFYLSFLVPMVEQLGGKLLSDDGRIAIEGEDAWIQVLTFMQQWGPNGLNLGSPTYRNARNSFGGEEGSVAMALSGLYQESRMKKQSPGFYDSDLWMVVPFPVFENAINNVSCCTYAHYFMVNASSDSQVQKASWHLAGYLLSHGEDYLKRGGGILQPTKALVNSKTLRDIPYSKVFIKDMERSKMIYFGSNSAEIQNLLGDAVESVMLNKVSPEKAYATLKASVQEILDEQRT